MGAIRVVLASLVAVICIPETQGGLALEDGVITGISLDETGDVHGINRSGGNKGGEVEEGEQKNETSVDRHDVCWETKTNGRGHAVRRGRTGLGRLEVVERTGLNRQRDQDGIRK